MVDANDVFFQIAVILFVASVVGFVAIKLKQPLIVGFIAVGIILGPSALGWVQANDQVDLLAKLGIAILLFIVGLKLDLHIIKMMGSVALATGIGQVAFTSLFGYLISLALGFSHTESLYIAVALTFSSTIIIVKLLSDKREVDSLAGRIAVGFLIVQDILVIIAMIALNALSGGDTNGNVESNVIQIFVYGSLFLLLIGVLMRYVLTPLLDVLAQSKELLIVFSIAWAVSLGALGHYLGFSKEVGAFVAGVSLASTPYRDIIGAKLLSLRDFLLLFFFVDLGATLDLSIIGGQVVQAIILSLFVLVGNPLIVMIIMGVMGYRKRTSFLAGLTVAQISEFSLILAALGVSLGHISSQILGLVTLVGLITISASTYMILYSHRLYNLLAPWLGMFERKTELKHTDEYSGGDARFADIIVFGLGRFGTIIADSFREKGFSVLAVDFDPVRIKEAKREGANACYGDAEDEEFIATLPIKHARWVVGAIHDKGASEILAIHLKEANFTGHVAFALRAADPHGRIEQNADFVIIPYEFAAQHAVHKLLALVPQERGDR